jgi:hypothetical protein
MEIIFNIFVRAIALMMEAASTSETSVNFYHSTRLHGATAQKTAIFILAAVRI